MSDSLAKTDEQSMQEFVASNRISHSVTADGHMTTVLAGAPILYSFIDQLSDARVSPQLVSAVKQLDSSYLQTVASQLSTGPSAEDVFNIAVKNLKSDKEHDLQIILSEAASLKFLVRLARAIEPPVIAHDRIPGDALLGAVDFLSYAAAFSEAT